MIVRLWQGVAPNSKTEEHVNYIRQQLLRTYLKAPGNRGALLLSRACADHTEFLLLSFWQSASSLEFLTGPDMDGAFGREQIKPFPIPMIKNFEVVISHLLYGHSALPDT